MGYTATKLVEIAEAEIGYHEKASNSNLDSKTANSGNKNFTKYGRDLFNAGFFNGNKNGFDWCAQFPTWCVWKLTGENKNKTEYILCVGGDLSAGCGFALKYYKAAGRFDKAPKVGDQIFFKYNLNDTSYTADHTGIVVRVTDKLVETIEGNSGNEVKRKAYQRTDKTIIGYGHPRYDAEPKKTVKPAAQPTKPAAQPSSKKSIDEIAREVISGKWGNGAERMNKLTNAGYNYADVQARVNIILSGKSAKSVTEIAKEVIAGKWGVGSERKRKLIQAGYDYDAVQKRVNELLK